MSAPRRRKTDHVLVIDKTNLQGAFLAALMAFGGYLAKGKLDGQPSDIEQRIAKLEAKCNDTSGGPVHVSAR